MSKVQKPYWEMNAKELAKATAAFDREMVKAPGRPLTPAQKALHARAHRRGRPPIGKGSERINVTIERGLLGTADKLAKLKGVSRAQLVALGLRQIIASYGKQGKSVKPATRKMAS